MTTDEAAHVLIAIVSCAEDTMNNALGLLSEGEVASLWCHFHSLWEETEMDDGPVAIRMTLSIMDRELNRRELSHVNHEILTLRRAQRDSKDQADIDVMEKSISGLRLRSKELLAERRPRYVG